MVAAEGSDRTGMLPFVFEDGFGFERYAEYALDVPMYFIYRDGVYNDASGLSFRDFLEGKLPGYEGILPTIKDWSDHLTTIFPEVRMKRFIEMRGADGGPWKELCALPAFWTGLLYNQSALDAAWDLVKDWTAEERETLRNEVPRLALKTPFRYGTVLDIARQVVELSKSGLQARGVQDGMGSDETIFLDVIEEVAESGKTRAEQLLERFHGDWNGDIDRVFLECAY